MRYKARHFLIAGTLISLPPLLLRVAPALQVVHVLLPLFWTISSTRD